MHILSIYLIPMEVTEAGITAVGKKHQTLVFFIWKILCTFCHSYLHKLTMWLMLISMEQDHRTESSHGTPHGQNETQTQDAANKECGGDVGAHTRVRRAGAMCERCAVERAAVRRPKDGARVCKACFYALFEDEIHRYCSEYCVCVCV
jgi:hypothetical protein